MEVYYITDYKSPDYPYEGHYLHPNVKVKKETENVKYYKGDILVETNQEANRYIVETLEPQATDSYFCWNFFDDILQPKEVFSEYYMEQHFEELLKGNDGLRKSFEDKKLKDKDFAKNRLAQLKYIFETNGSPDKSASRYPVARINNPMKLPLELNTIIGRPVE